MNLKFAAAAAVVAILSATAAQAEIIHFAATLSGADEVPAKSTAGKGTVTAELETKERSLAFRATYSDLSGPATMAHFHGPADAGANAGVQIAVKDPSSPIGGAAQLTQEQVDQLLAGKWYFNVHTAANPGGEIRGQLKRLN